MEVDFPAVAAENEAISQLGPQLRHGSDRLRGMRLDLAAHAPDLILQAPPRALERVVNREVEAEKALVRCRRPRDRDFPPVRQCHMYVDLVVAARPVMGARRLHHDAKGGDAPVALFDVRDAFENARLRFGDRLHPLEVDLRRRLDTASYCPLVHEVRSKSSGCRVIALIRSPFCLPRITWTASSSPRLTRCNTVWRETPSVFIASRMGMKPSPASLSNRAMTSWVNRMRHGAPGVSCSPEMIPALSKRWRVEGATPSTAAAFLMVNSSPSACVALGSKQGISQCRRRLPTRPASKRWPYAVVRSDPAEPHRLTVVRHGSTSSTAAEGIPRTSPVSDQRRFVLILSA